MAEPRYLTTAMLDELAAAAAADARLRRNLNLHAMEDPVHRLLNAMEPGTYVRPHRHATPPKAETAVVLAGRLGTIFFDAAGAVTGCRVLTAGGPDLGVDIPAGTFHTFVALTPGTVFFEAKPGPYVAPAGPDLGAWAPADGTPEAAAQERAWRALFA